jgi:hypothetical protein
MSAWLNTFLEQPVAKTPWSNGSRPVYCIIDRVRQPKALQHLYQQDGVNGIERLFQGTTFSEMNDVSPLWLPIKPETALAAKAIELCRTNRSGIFLTCSAPPKIAFQHAQRLLRMNATTHGDSLARFYDPAFWSALALTTCAQKLYGPWQSVYTPPANPDDQMWRTWQRPEGANETLNEEGYPLLLQDSTLAASNEIRWWYWVRARQSESANEPGNDQLPIVLDNLNLLVEHGIDEGRHLERLLPHLSLQALQDSPEFMNVLRSDMPAFEKVQRLEV